MILLFFGAARPKKRMSGRFRTDFRHSKTVVRRDSAGAITGLFCNVSELLTLRFQSFSERRFRLGSMGSIPYLSDCECPVCRLQIENSIRKYI